MKSHHATHEVKRSVEKQSDASHAYETPDVGEGTGAVTSAVATVVGVPAAVAMVVALAVSPVATAGAVAALGAGTLGTVRYASGDEPPGGSVSSLRAGTEGLTSTTASESTNAATAERGEAATGCD